MLLPISAIGGSMRVWTPIRKGPVKTIDTRCHRCRQCEVLHYGHVALSPVYVAAPRTPEFIAGPSAQTESLKMVGGSGTPAKPISFGGLSVVPS